MNSRLREASDRSRRAPRVAMTRLTRQENLRMALTRRLTSDYTLEGCAGRSRRAPGVAMERRMRSEDGSKEAQLNQDHADTTGPTPEQVKNHESTAGPTVSRLRNAPRPGKGLARKRCHCVRSFPSRSRARVGHGPTRHREKRKAPRKFAVTCLNDGHLHEVVC